MKKFFKFKISQNLDSKLNNLIEIPTSGVEKAWKAYSAEKMFDDPHEKFLVERAFKSGWNEGYFKGVSKNG